MKVSATIELVWQIAGQEAIAGSFKEIEPDHFCLALLKFSELPVEEVGRVANGAEVARELAVEVDAVREEIEGRTIDSKATRRALRTLIGKGDSDYDGGRMHRSQASRGLFDAASKLADDAGADTLLARHLIETLLASPTRAMAEVLGESIHRRKAKPSKTPLLDQCGRDLTALAKEGSLATDFERSAETKALLQILSQNNRRNVFLVEESDEAIRTVIESAAHVLVSGDAPVALKGKRLIDVSSVGFSNEEIEDSFLELEKAMGEASAAGDVILFGPAVDATSGSDQAPASLEWLRSAFSRSCMPHICRVAPPVYQQWIAKNRLWRDLAQGMWLHNEKHDGLPDEL